MKLLRTPPTCQSMKGDGTRCATKNPKHVKRIGGKRLRLCALHASIWDFYKLDDNEKEGARRILVGGPVVGGPSLTDVWKRQVSA